MWASCLSVSRSGCCVDASGPPAPACQQPRPTPHQTCDTARALQPWEPLQTSRLTLERQVLQTCVAATAGLRCELARAGSRHQMRLFRAERQEM